MLKVYRPCPLYRPYFVLEADDTLQTLRFHDSSTGFEAVFSAATHKLVSHRRQTTPIAIVPALELEGRYVRRSLPPSVLMSGDRHDTTKAAGSTGGGPLA